MPSCASSASAFSTITAHASPYAAALVGALLLVERALAQREHRRTRLRDPACERDHRVFELGGRHDAVDQTPLGRSRRVDHVAGEQHLEHSLARDRAAHGHHRGRAEQPDVHAGRGETGIVGRDGEVARGDQLTARGRGDAVHLGDDRLRDRVDPRHQLDARAEQLAVERVVAVPLDLGEVVTGRERRTAPLDHGDRRGRRADLVERDEHLPHQRQRQRVAPLGPVEGQPGKRRPDVQLEMLVRHQTRSASVMTSTSDGPSWANAAANASSS